MKEELKEFKIICECGTELRLEDIRYKNTCTNEGESKHNYTAKCSNCKNTFEGGDWGDFDWEEIKKYHENFDDQDNFYLDIQGITKTNEQKEIELFDEFVSKLEDIVSKKTGLPFSESEFNFNLDGLQEQFTKDKGEALLVLTEHFINWDTHNIELPKLKQKRIDLLQSENTSLKLEVDRLKESLRGIVNFYDNEFEDDCQIPEFRSLAEQALKYQSNEAT